MLEALLALSMLLIVGVALLNVNSLAVRQHQRLQQTRCENWLAENLLTLELLTSPMRNMADESGMASQCDQIWGWHIIRQKQADGRFYQVMLQLKDNHGYVRLERKILRAW